MARTTGTSPSWTDPSSPEGASPGTPRCAHDPKARLAHGSLTRRLERGPYERPAVSAKRRGAASTPFRFRPERRRRCRSVVAGALAGLAALWAAARWAQGGFSRPAARAAAGASAMVSVSISVVLAYDALDSSYAAGRAFAERRHGPSRCSTSRPSPYASGRSPARPCRLSTRPSCCSARRAACTCSYTRAGPPELSACLWIKSSWSGPRRRATERRTALRRAPDCHRAPRRAGVQQEMGSLWRPRSRSSSPSRTAPRSDVTACMCKCGAGVPSRNGV
jgi:hypothetical protein